MVKGFKLFRLRKDGTIGPLFINRKQVIEMGVEYQEYGYQLNHFQQIV